MRRSAILSLGLHAALLAGLLLWFEHAAPKSDTPDQQGAIELVMVEQEGKGATTAPAVPAPEPPAPVAPPTPPPPPPVTPVPPTDAPVVPPVPPPPVPPDNVEQAEPLPQPPPPQPPPPEPPPPQPVPPPPAPQPPQPQPAPSQPQPPRPPPPQPAPPQPSQASAPRLRPTVPPAPRQAEAPEINLGGTDSETNAIASGEHVIPASVDAKFHNKEPVYPPEAARRSQQGVVMLHIHVSPDGLPASVDVVQSSGYVLLDRSAHDAVETWHFLPAVKDGTPIPFDIKLRVVFHLD